MDLFYPSCGCAISEASAGASASQQPQRLLSAHEFQRIYLGRRVAPPEDMRGARTLSGAAARSHRSTPQRTASAVEGRKTREGASRVSELLRQSGINLAEVYGVAGKGNGRMACRSTPQQRPARACDEDDMNCSRSDKGGSSSSSHVMGLAAALGGRSRAAHAPLAEQLRGEVGAARQQAHIHANRRGKDRKQISRSKSSRNDDKWIAMVRQLTEKSSEVQTLQVALQRAEAAAVHSREDTPEGDVAAGLRERVSHLERRLSETLLALETARSDTRATRVRQLTLELAAADAEIARLRTRSVITLRGRDVDDHAKESPCSDSQGKRADKRHRRHHHRSSSSNNSSLGNSSVVSTGGTAERLREAVKQTADLQEEVSALTRSSAEFAAMAQEATSKATRAEAEKAALAKELQALRQLPQELARVASELACTQSKLIASDRQVQQLKELLTLAEGGEAGGATSTRALVAERDRLAQLLRHRGAQEAALKDEAQATMTRAVRAAEVSLRNVLQEERALAKDREGELCRALDERLAEGRRLESLLLSQEEKHATEISRLKAQLQEDLVGRLLSSRGATPCSSPVPERRVSDAGARASLTAAPNLDEASRYSSHFTSRTASSLAQTHLSPVNTGETHRQNREDEDEEEGTTATHRATVPGVSSPTASADTTRGSASTEPSAVNSRRTPSSSTNPLTVSFEEESVTVVAESSVTSIPSSESGRESEVASFAAARGTTLMDAYDQPSSITVDNVKSLQEDDGSVGVQQQFVPAVTITPPEGSIQDGDDGDGDDGEASADTHAFCGASGDIKASTMTGDAATLDGSYAPPSSIATVSPVPASSAEQQAVEAPPVAAALGASIVPIPQAIVPAPPVAVLPSPPLQAILHLSEEAETHYPVPGEHSFITNLSVTSSVVSATSGDTTDPLDTPSTPLATSATENGETPPVMAASSAVPAPPPAIVPAPPIAQAPLPPPLPSLSPSPPTNNTFHGPHSTSQKSIPLPPSVSALTTTSHPTDHGHVQVSHSGSSGHAAAAAAAPYTHSKSKDKPAPILTTEEVYARSHGASMYMSDLGRQYSGSTSFDFTGALAAQERLDELQFGRSGGSPGIGRDAVLRNMMAVSFNNSRVGSRATSPAGVPLHPRFSQVDSHPSPGPRSTPETGDYAVMAATSDDEDCDDGESRETEAMPEAMIEEEVFSREDDVEEVPTVESIPLSPRDASALNASRLTPLSSATSEMPPPLAPGLAPAAAATYTVEEVEATHSSASSDHHRDEDDGEKVQGSAVEEVIVAAAPTVQEVFSPVPRGIAPLPPMVPVPAPPRGVSIEPGAADAACAESENPPAALDASVAHSAAAAAEEEEEMIEGTNGGGDVSDIPDVDDDTPPAVVNSLAKAQLKEQVGESEAGEKADGKVGTFAQGNDDAHKERHDKDEESDGDDMERDADAEAAAQAALRKAVFMLPPSPPHIHHTVPPRRAANMLEGGGDGGDGPMYPTQFLRTMLGDTPNAQGFRSSVNGGGGGGDGANSMGSGSPSVALSFAANEALLHGGEIVLDGAVDAPSDAVLGTTPPESRVDEMDVGGDFLVENSGLFRLREAGDSSVPHVGRYNDQEVENSLLADTSTDDESFTVNHPTS